MKIFLLNFNNISLYFYFYCTFDQVNDQHKRLSKMLVLGPSINEGFLSSCNIIFTSIVHKPSDLKYKAKL